MKSIFLCFFMSGYVFSKCPSGSSELKYELSFEPKKQVICEMIVAGKPVKHGPHEKYNSNGKLASTAYYFKGKKVPKSSYDQLLVGKEVALPEIHQLFTALLPDKTSKALSEFDTNECDNGRIKDWITLLFTGTHQFTEVYKFAKKCDVDGKYSPQIDKYFPVDFKLKDFNGFNRVKMQVKLKLQGLSKLEINVKQGSLFGARSLKFSGVYSSLIVINQGRGVNLTSHGGSVLITELDGKAVNIKQDIVVPK